MDFVVGALRANADKVLRAAEELAAQGAGLVLFPELCLCGYPPDDLVGKRHFLEDGAAELDRIARDLPPEALVVVGAPDGGDDGVRNAAHLFFGGERVAVYHKQLLPNYGVFDEKRLFVPGRHGLVVDTGSLRLGVHICEDTWQADGPPCRMLEEERIDALLNLSASPFHRRKVEQRRQELGRTAGRLGAHLVYCNLVGGQDELVFDGGSMVLGPDGGLLARARLFREDVLWFDLPAAARGEPARGEAGRPAAGAVRRVALAADPAAARAARAPRIEALPGAVEEVYEALQLGLRDYVDKNGFKRTVVALSGGIDSALVAGAGRRRARRGTGRGGHHALAVLLPRHARRRRRDGPRPRRPLPRAAHRTPLRERPGAAPPALARVAAPTRPKRTCRPASAALLIMALSNKFGWLVLTTGNKSEMATGYCTLYGDMVGGFAVIKDVPKTLVFELARWRNAQPGGPGDPPLDHRAAAHRRAARRPEGQDSLPPYELLDPILERYVERDEGFDGIVAAGFDPGPRAPGDPPGRPQRVQAAPGRARRQDHAQGLRPRPAHADHQPVPRTHVRSLP